MFFGCEACWILAPWPEIEPLPLALKGEVLTTDCQGSPPHPHSDSYKAEIKLKVPVKNILSISISYFQGEDHSLYFYLILDPNSLKITDVGRFSVGY